MEAAQTLGFTGIISESKRIINAHSRHFLAISVLFLLPLSFSITVFPTLRQTLSHYHSNPSQLLLRLTTTSTTTSSAAATHILLSYSLLLFILSLCAIGATTHSVFQAFFGRPVKLSSSISSLSTSFIPLFITITCSQLAIFTIVSVFGILGFWMIRKIEYFLGFRILFDSGIGFWVGLGVLGLLVVFLEANWVLAPVIVVVESKWGFEPLRRSSILLKGMKRVCFSLILFFGFFMGVLLWSSAVSAVGWNNAGGGEEWRNWAFVGQIVEGSALVTLLMLYGLAANTVMYMYCKALSGELAGEIADEFSQEYVSLPFDDQKVPHVVTVI